MALLALVDMECSINARFSVQSSLTERAAGKTPASANYFIEHCEQAKSLQDQHLLGLLSGVTNYIEAVYNIVN